MAKRGDQRRRLLSAASILYKETDRAHPIPMPRLIERLQEQGIPAERKGLYADIAALQEAGLDLQYRGGAEGGWYLQKRLFEPAELKLLVDVVQAARFISKRKSRRLIDKLAALGSAPAAEGLQRHVYVDRRVKSGNEGVYYHVDRLHEAILRRRAVTFQYFDYNREKKKVFGHDGALYTVSPKALLWDHEKYYLAAYDHLNRELRHYRVDKMQDVTVTSDRQQGGEDDVLPDTAAYSSKLFGMFRGREIQVRLRCAADTAGIILDQFGMESVLTPEEDGGFIVAPRVALSPPFWGWLFTMGGEVELLSPPWAVEAYRERLTEVLCLYGGADRQSQSFQTSG